MIICETKFFTVFWKNPVTLKFIRKNHIHFLKKPCKNYYSFSKILIILVIYFKKYWIRFFAKQNRLATNRLKKNRDSWTKIINFFQESNWNRTPLAPWIINVTGYIRWCLNLIDRTFPVVISFLFFLQSL